MPQPGVNQEKKRSNKNLANVFMLNNGIKTLLSKHLHDEHMLHIVITVL